MRLSCLKVPTDMRDHAWWKISNSSGDKSMWCLHGLWTPREEIAFTARPKIHSHSQIFRYGGSIICLPHRPIFSDIFDLCLHWVSVVRGCLHWKLGQIPTVPKYTARLEWRSKCGIFCMIDLLSVAINS